MRKKKKTKKYYNMDIQRINQHTSAFNEITLRAIMAKKRLKYGLLASFSRFLAMHVGRILQ